MSSAKMLYVLITLTLPLCTISNVLCRTYEPRKKAKEIEKTRSLFCAFIMTEQCDDGDKILFTEGPAWTAQAMPNQCSERDNVFSCSCNTELCSSDHNYLMKLWKKSSQYSKNNKFTICLEKLIERDLEKNEDFYFGEDKPFERIQGEVSEEDDRDDLIEREKEKKPKKWKKLASGYVCVAIYVIAVFGIF